MKKLILTAALAASATVVFGQGAIQTGNNFGTTVAQMPIYGPDPSNPTLSLTGQSAIAVPVGSTVYNGPLLQGTGWDFAVYAGAQNADPSTFSLLTIQNFRTSASGGKPAGFAPTLATVTVPGVAAGTAANFQIRVWNNLNGTVNNWSTASADWAAGLLAAGESSVVTSGPLGGVSSGGPVSTPNTVGWSSFNAYFVAVPEPGTIALCGLGAASVLLFRRKK